MKLRAALIILAPLQSCGLNDAGKPHLPAHYETNDRSMVLITDGALWYNGTRFIPPGKDPLRDFGEKVKILDQAGVRCEVLGSLTFAISAREAFECNGYSFRSRKTGTGKFVVSAFCGTLRVDRCIQGGREGPQLSYAYFYIQGEGVEWLRFDDGKQGREGDFLRHTTGGRILDLKNRDLLTVSQHRLWLNDA